MNKKTIILITTIIITLLLLTTSTATETNKTEKTITKKINNDNIKKEKTKINVKNPEELDEAMITTSQSTDNEIEINLEKNTYSLENRLQLNIVNQNKTVTINGNHSTINGNNNLEFLKVVQNNTIILNDLIITNMKNPTGAISNYGTLICQNVEFMENHATLSSMGGGAIYNSGNLYLNNCTFKKNTAINNGGAIYARKTQQDCEIIINNTKFTENTAALISTMTLYRVKCQINNSQFTNNTASIINIQNRASNLSLYNTSFIEENSDQIIENENKCTINKCLFYNNNVNTIINNQKDMVVNNTEFKYNKATIIIQNKETANIENSTFTKNQIKDAIITNENSNEELTIIYNNKFIDNTANNTAGIKNTNKDNPILITKNLFRNNTSLQDKGILYTTAASSIVLENQFINNTSLDLFIGNIENYPEVKENIYIGNNLTNTTLNITHKEYYSTEENITLMIQLKTNPIYNTSITTGKILISYDNNIICQKEVNQENDTIEIENIYEGNKEFKVTYTGNGDYANTTITSDITIIKPKYNVTINVMTKEYKINQPIILKIEIETQQVPVNNITLTNILPNDLNYMSSSENIFNNTTNSIHINSMNQHSIKRILINTTSNIVSDLNITFNINDLKQENIITKNEYIKILKAEYEIVNIIYNTDSQVYGNNISYEITLKNKGRIEGYNLTCNIQNSTIYKKEIIGINEEIKIYYSTIIDKTGIFEKIFEINDSYNNYLQKNIPIEIISPSIQFDNIKSHPGDYVNITVTLDNIKIVRNKSVVFKINGKSIENARILCENKTITLLNYYIPDNFSSNKYLLEIKYNDHGFEESISQKSILKLEPLKVASYSPEIKGYSGSYVNIHVQLKDENNNPVTDGIVLIKINKRTLRDVKLVVRNGEVSFNFLIPTDYRNKYYEIMIIYGGSYRYEVNYTYSTLEILMKEVKLILNYTATNKSVTLNLEIYDKENGQKIENGNIAFKINDKTRCRIKDLSKPITFSYEINNMLTLKDVTAVYSGTNVYTNNRTTIKLENPLFLYKNFYKE